MLHNPKAFHHGIRDYEQGLPVEIPYSGKDLEDYTKGYDQAHRSNMIRLRKFVKASKPSWTKFFELRDKIDVPVDFMEER